MSRNCKEPQIEDLLSEALARAKLPFLSAEVLEA
jgi:hypothetical protein